MASAITGEVERNLDALKYIISARKEEVKQQFDLLRKKLVNQERAMYAQLDELYSSAVNATKGVLRSIEQLDRGKASLESTLKENHVLNLLEKTVSDLNVEKQRLVQESGTTRNVHLIWNLEPFINDLKGLCKITTTNSNRNFVSKNIILTRNPTGSFGFVIMTDATKLVSICRINTGSPAELGELRVGDILLELNGEDISESTHFDVVEKIRGLTQVSLLIRRISD